MANDDKENRTWGERTLTAFAYGLLLLAMLPAFTAFRSIGWALAPAWIIATTYVASMLKSMTSGEASERLDEVTTMLYITYYAIALVWPLPLHWYDALVPTALFAKGSALGNSLFALYYAVTAASYAGHAEVLQVMGRAILAVITGHAILH